MPIMRPEIQDVLRKAGLAPEKKVASDSPLDQQLEEAGLGLSEVLERYSYIIENTANETLKKSALDTVLKMHGALKETAPAPPSFTIVITGGSDAKTVDGVNPILLPRQLLNKVEPAKTN